MYSLKKQNAPPKIAFYLGTILFRVDGYITCVVICAQPSAPDLTLDLEMKRGLRWMVSVIRLVLEN